MKLKDCVHGVLVKTKDENYQIGMIVGIINNVTSSDLISRSNKDNAIPLVQWQHGSTYSIHYGNIEPFKDF